jgi:hypothetical protein
METQSERTLADRPQRHAKLRRSTVVATDRGSRGSEVDRVFATLSLGTLQANFSGAILMASTCVAPSRDHEPAGPVVPHSLSEHERE